MSFLTGRWGRGRAQCAPGASVAEMLATARDNLAKSTRAGVTVVRDAGDRYGINHAMRDELAAREDAPIELRSPGPALKRANATECLLATMSPAGMNSALRSQSFAARATTSRSS